MQVYNKVNKQLHACKNSLTRFVAFFWVSASKLISFACDGGDDDDNDDTDNNDDNVNDDDDNDDNDDDDNDNDDDGKVFIRERLTTMLSSLVISLSVLSKSGHNRRRRRSSNSSQMCHLSLEIWSNMLVPRFIVAVVAILNFRQVRPSQADETQPLSLDDFMADKDVSNNLF